VDVMMRADKTTICFTTILQAGLVSSASD